MTLAVDCRHIPSKKRGKTSAMAVDGLVVETHTHRKNPRKEDNNQRRNSRSARVRSPHIHSLASLTRRHTHTGRFNIKQHDGDGAPTRSPRLGLSTVHTRSDGLCARRWSRARKERGESSAKSREREKDKGSERLAGERESLGGFMCCFVYG